VKKHRGDRAIFMPSAMKIPQITEIGLSSNILASSAVMHLRDFGRDCLVETEAAGVNPTDL
jgi:hypothetical protein